MISSNLLICDVLPRLLDDLEPIHCSENNYIQSYKLIGDFNQNSSNIMGQKGFFFFFNLVFASTVILITKQRSLEA